FLVRPLANQDGVEVVSAILAIGAAVLVVAAAVLVGRAPAQAFAATCGAIALFFCALFADLFPYVMVSTTDPSFSLTLNEASSSNYTLSVMTVVAVLLVPVVLLYQAWTYWVFRRRLSAEDFGEVRTPIDLLSSGEHHGSDSTGARARRRRSPGDAPAADPAQPRRAGAHGGHGGAGPGRDRARRRAGDAARSRGGARVPRWRERGRRRDVAVVAGRGERRAGSRG